LSRRASGRGRPLFRERRAASFLAMTFYLKKKSIQDLLFSILLDHLRDLGQDKGFPGDDRLGFWRRESHGLRLFDYV
jgi:hypothetical protein